jgi:fluoroacetyl-CoA thioesterase
MVYTVKVGSMKERKIKINTNQSISFLWAGENIFSTPSMISEMEETCRLLLKEQYLLDVEWDSIGTVVEVKHLAPTPVGAEILVNGRVSSVNGRRVMFDVEANDAREKIGEGRHERFIIHIPSFRNRFIEKQKQLENKL